MVILALEPMNEAQFVCYCYHQWSLGHYYLAGLGARLAYEAEPVRMDDNLTCSSSLRQCVRIQSPGWPFVQVKAKPRA